MEYLISITVGAIIGYVTNWLAIKMLFRPQKEIRLRGKRLPFTPGLIPKEKERIATSVGKTIGEHLLTKDTLLEALDNDRIRKHIRKWIGDKVRDFKNNSHSLEELLKKLLGQRYTRVKEKIKSLLIAKTINYIQTEASKDKFKELIQEFIKKALKSSPENLIANEHLIKTKEFTMNKLKDLRDSENFKDKLQVYIEKNIVLLEQSEKSLQDILPGGL